MGRLATGAVMLSMAFLVGPLRVAADEPGQLTLEVTGLVGMEGLELAAVMGSSPRLGHYSWGDAVGTRRPIDASSFSGELGTFPVGADTHELVLMVGEPPCAVVYFAPVCAESNPDYVCSIRLDVPPGEHISLTIDGLPPYESPRLVNEVGIGPGCPVSEIRHEGVPSTE